MNIKQDLSLKEIDMVKVNLMTLPLGDRHFKSIFVIVILNGKVAVVFVESELKRRICGYERT